MSWSFTDLNLNGVEAQKGAATLKPGRYVCEVSEAELKTTKAGGRQLFVKLNDINGGGYVADWITLTHPKAATDKGSKQAVEIGMSRLKALLLYGGHPNPDRPGDIASVNGLVVGVNVEQSEDWTDDKGVTRKGGGKPAKSGAYFSPADIGHKTSGAKPAGSKPEGVDDDIPF